MRDMEPARTIVTKLGGPSEVSRFLGVHRTYVYRWLWPAKRRGTGGRIPFRYIPALIAEAKARGIAMSADEFLPVQEAAE